MGKQNHSFPITGRVDTLSFYQQRDGTHMVRKKKNAGAVFTSEKNYQVLQKNRQEFQRAANAGKLIRHALRNPLSTFRDKTGTGRLAKLFLAVVKSDPINRRGERNLKDGDLNIINKYEFNPKSQLTRILRPAFQTTIDRITGKLTVTIPSFVPRKGDINAPQGSTHFKILAAGIEVDFANKYDKEDLEFTPLMPIDDNPTNPIVLECSFPPNNVNSLILVMGIEFYSDTNGYADLLENGAFNALSVVDVNKA